MRARKQLSTQQTAPGSSRRKLAAIPSEAAGPTQTSLFLPTPPGSSRPRGRSRKSSEVTQPLIAVQLTDTKDLGKPPREPEEAQILLPNDSSNDMPWHTEPSPARKMRSDPNER
ncbi:MAG: hypothetical protein SGCHY_002355, partial [Lobulomycetales sp.]